MNARKLSLGLLPVLLALLLVAPVLAGTPGHLKYARFVSGAPTVGLRQPALARDNTMYVGGDDGHVYAINPDGSIKWTYGVNSRVTTNAAVYYSPDGQHAQHNGTIYVGLDDGRVLALHPAGNLKWEFDTGRPIVASPALAADGTIYVCTESAGLVAIRPNGTERWGLVLPGASRFYDPAVGPDGTIYVGARGPLMYFYALNPDGSTKWATYIPDGIYGPAAIGKDGTIYFLGGGYSLHALWPNGDPKWQCYLQHVDMHAAPVIGHEGTIYVSAERLIAINPDGSWAWDFWYGGERPQVSSSAAVDSDGLIYFHAHSDGHTYCVAPGGTFVWRYYAATPGHWVSASVIGSDGLLYSTDYARVWALYTGTTGPFDGPWPMYRRDAQCTARLDKLWSIISELKGLLAFVAQADLTERLKGHLAARLNSAMESLEAGLLLPAVHKLGAFVHYVEAQAGKKIPEELADVLIRDALHILSLADGYWPPHKPCWRRWGWGCKHRRFAPCWRHWPKHLGRFRWRGCGS